MLPLVWLVAKVVLLISGLLVPGAALARVLQVPRTLATCFAGSALSLYVTILALQLSSTRISLGSLTSGLFVITALAWWARRLLTDQTSEHFVASASLLSPTGLQTWMNRMGAWAPVYLIFWVVVLWRAWHEPLAGPDIEFRWSFLAEQMLRFGSLDFYPPNSAKDFFSYFWVESIPPGASALHAWAYACAGSPMAAWTVPAVVLQVWAVHELIGRTAAAMGGVLAARFACLAAVACPFLTWSILIGQETGLTALSLVGVCFAVHSWRETRAWGWAGLAGIFAVIGASAREYGLVFPALATVALAIVRADRRAWFSFVVVAVVSLVWPLRVWILTGNPFYSLSVAGLFPVNERFVAWIEHDADALGAILHSAAGWRELARYIVLYAPTALLGWLAILAATTRGRRHAAFAFIATSLTLGLWAISVRYTNGGPFYSLRVASPAFAVGALAAGISFARFASSGSSARVATTGLLVLILITTLPATLALPRNPWRTSPAAWPAFVPLQSPRPEMPDRTVDIVLEALRASSGPNGNSRVPNNGSFPDVILADSPGYQRRFAPTGVRVVPLWSPQADWLFDAHLSPAAAARAWRDSGVTHMILTKWEANLTFFKKHSRWERPPFHVQLVGETDLTAVFSIRAID